jgi:preprotein translocase subunit SecE
MEEGEVAESKRRGEDAVDEHLDEVFVDAVDDEDARAEFDNDATDGFDDDAEDAPAKGRRGSADGTKPPTGTKGSKSVETASPGPFERITRFLREVVAELRKVNWPSRHELLTYTTVVILFVVVMMLIVAGLDWAFGWLVTHVFG